MCRKKKENNIVEKKWYVWEFINEEILYVEGDSQVFIYVFVFVKNFLVF